MKIAVTYENGQVFQHFGHCENFKIYNVEDGKVTDSQVVSAVGSGHEMCIRDSPGGLPYFSDFPYGAGNGGL